MGVLSRYIKDQTKLITNGRNSLNPVNVTMGIATAPLSYMAYRDEGQSELVAGARTVAETAGWLFAEPLMWGMMLGGAAKEVGSWMVEEGREGRMKQSQIAMQGAEGREGFRGGTLSGKMVDSEMAYTMRQRQMNVLRQHRIATESILGSEARQLHR